jgi:hypothetical protein
MRHAAQGESFGQYRQAEFAGVFRLRISALARANAALKMTGQK